MALTPFQRAVCRLVADRRVAEGESYLAGGAALNELLAAPRVSRDLDLFHDTESAVDAAWQADRSLLKRSGYSLRVIRERPAFVEAEVSRDGEVLLLQWVRDTAFRFYPLVEHAELGLVLHPFDLATNKVLALVGRLEARDWVDVIECDVRLQPLGYLAWAACGKDPGFSPLAILEHAARSAHYSRSEIASLAFDGAAPDAGELARRWRAMLEEAHRVVTTLPADDSGKCVLDQNGLLFRGDAPALTRELQADHVAFHEGSIRGALPQIAGGAAST